MNYEQLLADIRAVIKPNGEGEITGQTMQNVLVRIVEDLASCWTYGGVIGKTTVPDTDKPHTFYLLAEVGNYPNLGGIEHEGGIGIALWDGASWDYENLPANAIITTDAAPTAGSTNPVQSGGTCNAILTDGSAFDLSAYNSGTTYADLSAALTAMNSLPAAYKKGGMSIKFVQTSDNNYVKFFCTADEFTTDVTKWAICDDEVLVENLEFIEAKTDFEGKVLEGTKKDGTKYIASGLQVKGKIDNEELDESINSKITKVNPDTNVNNEDTLGYFEPIESPEWLSVETDSEGKVLGGRRKDGTKVENMPIVNPTLNGKVDKEEGKTLIDEEIANSQFVEHRDENLEMVVDSELRIIDYRDKTGKIHRAFPTNQDDIIQGQLDAIVSHVYPNLSAIVSPQEFNRVKEDKCNNNVSYLLYSNHTNPFEHLKIIKNGKFIEDFSGRNTQVKVCLFGDTHFGNTITGTFVLDPTIEQRCGEAFTASNSKNADFSLILGDVYEESYDHEINKQIYNIYHQELNKLETPCFQIEGNHDEEMLYKDGTEFVNEITKTGIIQFNNIRIICFNAKIHYRPTPDIEDIGDVSDEVYEWLENAVKDSYNNGYITILANHYELAFDANDSAWDEPIGTHRDDIIQLCGDYDVKLYLNGHEHIPNLIYKTITTNNKILTNIEFGRTALSYSVMEIKNGENGEGFYISEYETLTDDLANTLFVPMELTNASQIIKTTYKELTPLSRN